ncbi:hypothetical protein NAEGRDRAFT_80509 [Naegleria gruberi]|uniref:NTF2 domain-containing protein n=1 Tax=Naegleria gruberi TaxID=5762 RepID=D2VM53_NAEGR|nr:uncharacterized protein NAEGRDRAFT_80509 [Naegleria gruberi]EFC42260.1 hypothetical protein NAEGRDRAFT_80509 [Naegleria gruberi]|eukprot:XP_002675004.1 hypothetical protein NAEGRDRAFT_80509 [Naegleria gruberi strain NEG-M]
MSTPYPSTRGGNTRGGFRGSFRGSFRGNSRGSTRGGYQNSGSTRGGYQGGGGGRGGFNQGGNNSYNNNSDGGSGGGGGYNQQGNNTRGGGSFRGRRGGYQGGNDGNYQPRGGYQGGNSGNTRGGFQSGGGPKRTPFREKLKEWVLERTSEEGQLVKLDFMCVDDTLKGMSNNGYDDGLIRQVCASVVENFASDEDVITLCKIFPQLEVLDDAPIPPQLRKSGSTLPQINPYNLVEGLSEDNLRKYLTNLFDHIDCRKTELQTLFAKDAFITYSNSTNEYVDYVEDSVEIEAFQKLQQFSRDILNIPDQKDTKSRKTECNEQLKSSIISSSNILKFFNALPNTKHNIERITSDALSFSTRQVETNALIGRLCVSVHGHVIFLDNNGDKHTKSFDTSFILKKHENSLLISNFIYHIRPYSNFDLEFFLEITQFISKTKLKPQVAQQIFNEGRNLEGALLQFEIYKQSGQLNEQHFQQPQLVQNQQ